MEPTIFSFDQYWSICSLYVIIISIVSKLILFNFETQFQSLINLCVKSDESLKSTNHCEVMVNAHGYMWTSILVLIAGG